MYNILVTGSNGQLGSEIKTLSQDYKYNFYFSDKDELDVSKKESVEEFCLKNKIDIIINCAAYTAVDRAQEEQELADMINHKAPKALALISKENDIKLIHISTDYIFDGMSYKPYIESDTPNPKNIYGKTKLLGEKAIEEINPKNSIIIRTSWVYSSFGNNFVKTMLKLSKDKDELSVICDQVGTPTYAKDLARLILDIVSKVQNKDVEIFHYSNEGVCSWYDFAKAIFELSGIKIKVNPIETKEYPTPAKRPYYSLLNKSKIKEKFDITIPYWRDSLRKCLQRLNDE